MYTIFKEDVKMSDFREQFEMLKLYHCPTCVLRKQEQ
jgi:hypothetical protein